MPSIHNSSTVYDNDAVLNIGGELKDAKICIIDVYQVMFYFGPHFLFYTCMHTHATYIISSP
jgi:hypothetical protein